MDRVRGIYTICCTFFFDFGPKFSINPWQIPNPVSTFTVHLNGATILRINFKIKRMNKALNEAIERLMKGKVGQFIIVVKPTISEGTEKVLINGKIIPNNAYLSHITETHYPIKPNVVYFIDYADSYTFYSCFSLIIGGALDYNIENVHVIFDRSIESNDLPPEILFNQNQLLEYRIDFLNEIGEERKEKYFGGEFIILGKKWEGNMDSYTSFCDK